MRSALIARRPAPRPRCARRSRPPPRATPAADADPPLASTLDALCDAALAGAVDSVLLDLLPDDAFVEAAERWEAATARGGGGDAAPPPRSPPLPLATATPTPPGPSFLDVVRHSGDISFDACALRGLILAPPRTITPTAALRPSPGRAVVRLAVTAHAGEEMTLELALVGEERASAHYRSVRAVRRWALAAARGEPRSASDADTPPTFLHPRFGPETMLRATLQALAGSDGAVAGALLARAPPGSAPARLAAAAAGAGAPPAGLDMLLADGIVTDILSVRMLAADAALAVVGAVLPPRDTETTTLFDGRGRRAPPPPGRRAPPPPDRRAALVWRLGLHAPGGGPPPLDGDGCWGVEGVELAGGWADAGGLGGCGIFPWPVF